MFKSMTQQLHERFGGSVVTLPQADYSAPFFPVPNDTANFGPRVAQTTFGPAEEAARHEDAVLDTVSIQTLLGRCLSRLMKLQTLEFVEDAEQRLQPLKDALGAAFAAAEIEDVLIGEFQQSADEQHEAVLGEGAAQAKKVQRLESEVQTFDMAFENIHEALKAKRNELSIRKAEQLPRWATKKDRAKRQAGLDAVQQEINALKSEGDTAVAAYNAKRAEYEQEHAALVELDRDERRLRAIVEGNRFAVDPELGLSPGIGVEPMIRA